MDTKEAVQKYWPWGLGILAVGFFLMRGGSQSTTTPMGYDPNLMKEETERYALQTAMDTTLGQAGIQASAGISIAEFQAVGNMFDSLAGLNDSFIMGNIAAYSSMKDTSIASMNVAGNITEAGLREAGATTAAFHEAIGESTRAAAQITSSVAMANARSADAFGGFLSRTMSMGIMG